MKKVGLCGAAWLLVSALSAQCELLGTYEVANPAATAEGMEEELELKDGGKYEVRWSAMNIEKGGQETFAYIGDYTVKGTKVTLKAIRIDKKKRVPALKLVFDAQECSLSSKVKKYKK